MLAVFVGSRATAQHYKTKEWLSGNWCVSGMKSVQPAPLLNSDEVLVLPLHIKLGSVKNFLKAMAKQNSNGFVFLSKKFPKLSQVKMKEGVFVDP